VVAVGAGAAVAAEEELAARAVGVNEEIAGGFDRVAAGGQGGVVLEESFYGHGWLLSKMNNE
jgi:hypothetical protein